MIWNKKMTSCVKWTNERPAKIYRWSIRVFTGLSLVNFIVWHNFFGATLRCLFRIKLQLFFFFKLFQTVQYPSLSISIVPRLVWPPLLIFYFVLIEKIYTLYIVAVIFYDIFKQFYYFYKRSFSIIRSVRSSVTVRTFC